MNTNAELINQLKDAGFEVKIQHYRYFYGGLESNLERYYRHKNARIYSPETKGGATRVTLEKSGGSFIGIAYCSLKDNYCYKEGVRIALERALENYQEFLSWAEGLLGDD